VKRYLILFLALIVLLPSCTQRDLISQFAEAPIVAPAHLSKSEFDAFQKHGRVTIEEYLITQKNHSQGQGSDAAPQVRELTTTSGAQFLALPQKRHATSQEPSH
jgi:hypothetical protein